MEQRAASVFDTCLEQALQQAEPLMMAMGNAALASLRTQLLDPDNASIELSLQQAITQLKSKKTQLPAYYAQRLRQAAFLIAGGKRADYHPLLGGDTLAGNSALESEVLRTQIAWGRAQIHLLQQTEESLLGLERVYRPLRTMTLYWRNGNPLHHTVYLDSLQAALHEQGIAADVTSLFLADMVGVMADHLQTNYRRIMGLAMNSYAELLAKAESKRQIAKDGTKTFARQARKLFVIPEHCPVGAVRAYKTLIPVMERLAVRDPSFWDDAAHPARLLVQTIVDKAMALKESGGVSSYPQFPGLVSEAVETLCALKNPSADDFAQAVARFGVPIKPRQVSVSSDSSLSGYSSSMLAGSQWDVSELMSVMPEPENTGPVASTEVLTLPSGHVDQASPAADLQRMEQEVMSLMAMNVHSIDADPTVLAALISAWPQVLVQVAQQSGEQSSTFHAYRQVVPDVLALAGASVGAGVHREADALIPAVLTRLKSGLTGIGWMPERIASVLSAVARRAPSAIVELQMERETLAPSPAQQMAETMALHGTGVQAPVWDAAQVTASLAPQATVALEDGSAFRICGCPLETGVWLEFLSQGMWVAKQLSWSNARSTMFLFTAGDGSSQSLTRRILEKLELDRTVRPFSR